MKIELSDKEAEFLIRALVNNYAEVQKDFEDEEHPTKNNIGTNSMVGLLTGKLVSGNYKLMQVFNKVFNEKFSAKEQINKYLFMGSGWQSIILKNMLHKRLEFAVSVLGGMQQNGGMGTEFDEDSDKQDKEDLKNVIKDMLVAFNLKIEDLK